MSCLGNQRKNWETTNFKVWQQTTIIWNGWTNTTAKINIPDVNNKKRHKHSKCGHI